MVARLWYGLCVGLCVFDLDHTLIRTPLDLAAMAADMRGLIEAATGPLPYRRERYRAGELIAYCRTQAPTLEPAAWDLALVHERRAMQVATLEAGAPAAVAGAPAGRVPAGPWGQNTPAPTPPPPPRAARPRGGGPRGWPIASDRARSTRSWGRSTSWGPAGCCGRPSRRASCIR